MQRSIFVITLCFLVTPVKATIFFDDGGVHDVNSVINEQIEIRDNFWGESTTVNIFSSTEIGVLQAWDSSKLNIYGGLVTHLFTFDEAQTIIYDGEIEWSVYVRNNSQMFIYDGTIGGYLYGRDTSTINISGGLISESLHAEDNGQINIMGGTISDRVYIESSSSLVSIRGNDFMLDGHSVQGVITNTSGQTKSAHLTGTYFNGNAIDLEFIMWPDTSIILTPEPATPPDADADGPYSIYVGDVLTLDANGSTDADNDIVSFIWDLDDDENFETDAGGQAIFDVNYTYLQSLGLIADNTYDIHVLVTDNQGQSDIADSTFIIVSRPATVVAVDIKPGSCPNPVNVKSSGVLPVAILGTGDYDVTTIDPTSIAFSFGEISVGAIRSGYEDVAGPVSDSNDCNCVEAGPDGLLDLTLKFKTQRIVEAVGDVNDGDVLTLELTGVLYDPIPFETPIEGADCILIKGWHKAHNKADINKDGVVDMTDFAIVGENWLAGI